MIFNYAILDVHLMEIITMLDKFHHIKIMADNREWLLSEKVRTGRSITVLINLLIEAERAKPKKK